MVHTLRKVTPKKTKMPVRPRSGSSPLDEKTRPRSSSSTRDKKARRRRSSSSCLRAVNITPKDLKGRITILPEEELILEGSARRLDLKAEDFDKETGSPYKDCRTPGGRRVRKVASETYKERRSWLYGYPKEKPTPRKRDYRMFYLSKEDFQGSYETFFGRNGRLEPKLELYCDQAITRTDEYVITPLQAKPKANKSPRGYNAQEVEMNELRADDLARILNILKTKLKLPCWGHMVGETLAGEGKNLVTQDNLAVVLSLANMVESLITRSLKDAMEEMPKDFYWTVQVENHHARLDDGSILKHVLHRQVYTYRYYNEKKELLVEKTFSFDPLDAEDVVQAGFTWNYGAAFRLLIEEFRPRKKKKEGEEEEEVKLGQQSILSFCSPRTPATKRALCFSGDSGSDDSDLGQGKKRRGSGGKESSSSSDENESFLREIDTPPTSVESAPELPEFSLSASGGAFFKGPQRLWYHEDKMQKAFDAIAALNPNIESLCYLLGTDSPDASNMLKHNLAEYMSNRNTRESLGKSLPGTTIIPLNLNENHWCMLKLKHTKEGCEVYFQDPVGAIIPSEVKRALQGVFGEDVKIVSSTARYQPKGDAVNCGVYSCMFAASEALYGSGDQENASLGLRQGSVPNIADWRECFDELSVGSTDRNFLASELKRLFKASGAPVASGSLGRPEERVPLSPLRAK